MTMISTNYDRDLLQSSFSHKYNYYLGVSHATLVKQDSDTISPLLFPLNG